METNQAGKRLIFNPLTSDLKEFEELGIAAKDAGFTHLCISGLSERTDFGGDDKDSPWCEWSAQWASFFKHATPPGLEEAFPPDFVKRQMEFMKAKHAIVARLGLRAAYYTNEPHWLSERVYANHPEWRGSRCDNSLRSVGMFFAPNTDHPEVRDLYRRAVQEIVRGCPLLDTFIFFSNDSGSGFPWAEMLYVNRNGPTGTERKDMGARIAEFADCIRQGAEEGGGREARVFPLLGFYTPNEAHLINRSLQSKAEAGGLGGIGMGDRAWFPIANAPLFGGAIAAAEIHASNRMYFWGEGSRKDFFTAFKTALEIQPVRSEREKVDALLRLAEAVYAADVRDEVVDAWYILERAATMAHAIGLNTLVGPVMLRWLTRPMVPHQEMLTEEERSYWEPFIYQSRRSQPESYLDYLNFCGTSEASTWDEAKLTCCAIDRIEQTLAAAARKMETARDKTGCDAARRKLEADIYRVKAYRCVALTCRHALQIGTLIQEHRRTGDMPSSVSPELDLPQGMMGSHALFYLHRAMRWELDNTNELISLLKNSPEPLFFHDPNPANEGPLVLGPNVLDHLQRKVRIMLKYWRTAEIGYYLPTKGG